jgi:hypothetical protein
MIRGSSYILSFCVMRLYVFDFNNQCNNSYALILLYYRSLWNQENELTAEIDKLRAEVEKAEKSLDHAIPGVSSPS